MLQRYGIEVGIITGRTSKVVDFRAKELGIELVYQGSLKKIESYNDVKQKTGLEDSQIAYMGDDVIDVPVMRRVAFATAPADALVEARNAAHYVASLAGGRGAVREVCDLILKGRGLWHEVATRYELA
jgi:3-deoxy-D-manno-octulosonate 8-phosphate phosphatase (KDO 8-P phosphatase)